MEEVNSGRNEWPRLKILMILISDSKLFNSAVLYENFNGDLSRNVNKDWWDLLHSFNSFFFFLMSFKCFEKERRKAV